MRFFNSNDSAAGIITLASANVGLSGVSKFFVEIDGLFHVLLAIAQIGVAAVTIYYIWSKARKVILDVQKEKPSNKKPARRRKRPTYK